MGKVGTSLATVTVLRSCGLFQPCLWTNKEKYWMKNLNSKNLYIWFFSPIFSDNTIRDCACYDPGCTNTSLDCYLKN